MSLHDEYARVTPWELAFESPAAAQAFADEVHEEAEGRGADPELPQAFLTMGSVDAFIRRLATDDGDEGALVRYGGLAFQAYHFTRAECPLYVLSVHAVRYLVEGAPQGSPVPPSDAGYLQLPQHLFWTLGDGAGGPPESIDGLFWTVGSNGFLHVMLATGVRPDRPGIGIVPLPPAPISDASDWMDIDARGDGTDFEAAIPGGELDRLHALGTAGEVLKLLARCFAHGNAVPEALMTEGASEPSSVDGPIPSTLPYVRIGLGA